MILTSNTEATENKVQVLIFAYKVKGFQCHSNNSLQLLELKEKTKRVGGTGTTYGPRKNKTQFLGPTRSVLEHTWRASPLKAYTISDMNAFDF